MEVDIVKLGSHLSNREIFERRGHMVSPILDDFFFVRVALGPGLGEWISLLAEATILCYSEEGSLCNLKAQSRQTEFRLESTGKRVN
jgi:hypothetical protein